MRIHLGANSRPISFEYYIEDQNTQQTTSATYYYHYDLHGNVIRVTNSSGTTVIQYTYDQLGSIVSETNPNSIECGCVVAIFPNRGNRYQSTNLFKSFCSKCPP
ncbi:MAG: hypothetical protein KA140_07395 [Caldisericia bacterium]|nr:hypothetical protein [Caldisericia bacterium]